MSVVFWRTICSAFFLGLIFIIPKHALAAPKAEYWAIWDKVNEQSIEKIDHSLWQQILSRYVVAGEDGINRLDYRKLLVEDRSKLEDYLNQLTGLNPRNYTQDEQLAYWINLYNALTVKVILDHYPTKSILDIGISPGLFNFGPWDKKLMSIDGVLLSLNDIEHRILRPIWKSPLIHYAVNCASNGCPNLSKTAYDGENVNRMLELAAISYINHPRGVNATERHIEVSKIFKWYQTDFGRNDQEVLDHILKYASADLKKKIGTRNKINKYGYDWDLNEVPAN